MSAEPDTLEAEIEGLLAVARDGDTAQARLRDLLDKVRRGVLLGPRTRRYLDSLRALLPSEAPECRAIGREGSCRASGSGGIRCAFVDNWSACPGYAPAPAGRRGNPLRAEVVNHGR